MTPAQCPNCGGDRLFQSPLAAQHPVKLRLTFWKWLAVQGSACLDCGAVLNYLDDAALNRLRASQGLGEAHRAVAHRKPRPIDDF